MYDATTDADRIKAWWKRHPTANLALRTGQGSVDVLDVDVHADGSGYPAYHRLRNAGLIAGHMQTVVTPSGGLHAYYPGSQQPSGRLPAHHLVDAATLTCWANDYDYAGVFQRQVETLVVAGDVLVALSTSGNSPNVVAAAEAANRLGAHTIALTGAAGGRLAALCRTTIAVPSPATERIQEGHITVIHLLCELVERTMFGGAPAPS